MAASPPLVAVASTCWHGAPRLAWPAQEAEDWKEAVERLRAITEKDMWRNDLDAFEQVGLALLCAPGPVDREGTPVHASNARLALTVWHASRHSGCWSRCPLGFQPGYPPSSLCPASPQALGEHEDEEAHKEAQLARQQAKARAGQKAAAKKAVSKGKGKRNQWSDDEGDELSDSSAAGEWGRRYGRLRCCISLEQRCLREPLARNCAVRPTIRLLPLPVANPHALQRMTTLKTMSDRRSRRHPVSVPPPPPRLRPLRPRSACRPASRRAAPRWAAASARRRARASLLRPRRRRRW